MTDRRLPSDEVRKRLVRAHADTNPNYGKRPEDRTIEELLDYGMINLDKPWGPTSHQVVAWLKDILGIGIAGHGGTLDPRVTGVLPVALGASTKAIKVLLEAGKEYVCVMRLHRDLDPDTVVNACNSFVGSVSQMPPVRSAVARRRRMRRIYYLDVLEICGRDVLFRVGCEAGTYIRTLCVDIGRKLKCGAHMQELRRTRTGRFGEDSLSNLHDVLDACVFWKNDGDESWIRKVILPIERLFDHLPKVVVRDSAVGAVCHGANLAVPGIVQVDSGIAIGDTLCMETLKGEAVAVAKSLMTSDELLTKGDGIAADTLRVIMPTETYPKIWKKT
ncbi:MAG: RNA-guided pseudouridylation complex pseudouridine synthase subunit Cbf5 [Thermoplasmata archaeon HGW-Thermoplasmata-1]|nr:MAG: RNA-guided pseudouridylation complex pseudouridine synthase subunit Cbf5 [Thermoplasmata archaeon HGW-Thermoplasmata-1]